MNKIKTGVPGLDEILKGGLREKAAVIITGAPGTGKSILTLQFISQGLKNKEKCMFVTSEETAESLKEYAKDLSIELDEKNLMIYEYKDPKTPSLAEPIRLIKKNKVKRVVLDSISLFEYIYFKDILAFRKGVFDFITMMKQMGVTLIATSQKETTHIDNIIYKPEDFLFDGLILVTRIRKGSSFERVLAVSKMRGQEHLLDVFPMNIEKGGIKVFTNNLPFSLIEKEDTDK